MRRAVSPWALALACAAWCAATFVCCSGEGSPEPAGETVAQSVEAQGEYDLAQGLLGEAQRTEYESELGLAEAATDLLEGCRERGDCVVARSGYLDLTGRAWGCVLQGDGWVEVCVVREGGDGGGSAVVTWRMDASDVAALSGGS